MVLISQVKNMFWGVTIDAGKRYSQIVNDGFRLSMAALEQGSGSANDFVQVLLQHQSSEFLLCSLQHGKLLQQPLDLMFSAGEEVSFSLNGKGVVHLTGYLLNDEPDLSDSDDDAPELVDDSGDALVAKKRKALMVPTQSKRLKLVNDIADEDSGDDDDDDDMEDSFSEDDLSFEDDDEDENEDSDIEENDDDDDEVDDSEDEEDESIEDKGTVVKTKQNKKPPQKTPNKKPDSSVTPKGGQQVKEQKKNQSGKNETPKQGKEKQNAAASASTEKKQQQQTPTTTSNTPTNGESSKKKKKNKKKKKKDGNESMNESASSTPGSTPKSEAKAKVELTPKKKVVAGGTVVEDLKVGHGPEAKPGKMVSVYYVGTLAKNNKRFDSCTDGKPFRFRLSQGEVIKGWDNGLNGMKVGGKRKITVPANQGYGNVRQGPIPPNSSLVFEVELKAVS